MPFAIALVRRLRLSTDQGSRRTGPAGARIQVEPIRYDLIFQMTATRHGRLEGIFIRQGILEERREFQTVRTPTVGRWSAPPNDRRFRRSLAHDAA